MKISDRLIGKVLLVGVLISTSLVLFGGILFLIQHGTETHLNHIFSKSREIFSFRQVGIDILEIKPRALILFGLAVLLLTQLIRVLLTAWYFLEKKEKLYFWVSVLVFGILIFSIWKGI